MCSSLCGDIKAPGRVEAEVPLGKRSGGESENRKNAVTESLHSCGLRKEKRTSCPCSKGQSQGPVNVLFNYEIYKHRLKKCEFGSINICPLLLILLARQ